MEAIYLLEQWNLLNNTETVDLNKDLTNGRPWSSDVHVRMIIKKLRFLYTLDVEYVKYNY